MYPQNPELPPQSFGTPAPPEGYPGYYPGQYLGPQWSPAPSSFPSWVAPLIALVATAALLGGGFAAYQHYLGSPSSSSESCSVTGAETLTMDRKRDDEPTVTIPAVPGWVKINRGDIPGTDGAFNSPAVRGVVINVGIAENGFAPNIVVTLNRYPDTKMTPEAINDVEDQKLGKTANIGSRTVDTVCGNEVFSTEFSDLDPGLGEVPTSGTSMLTVVDAPDGSRWVSTATIQTRNPSNSDYLTQRRALGEGFRLYMGSS